MVRTNSKFSGLEFEKIHGNIGSQENFKAGADSFKKKITCRNEKCADHPIIDYLMLSGDRRKNVQVQNKTRWELAEKQTH